MSDSKVKKKHKISSADRPRHETVRTTAGVSHARGMPHANSWSRRTIKDRNNRSPPMWMRPWTATTVRRAMMRAMVLCFLSQLLFFFRIRIFRQFVIQISDSNDRKTHNWFLQTVLVMYLFLSSLAPYALGCKNMPSRPSNVLRKIGTQVCRTNRRSLTGATVVLVFVTFHIRSISCYRGVGLQRPKEHEGSTVLGMNIFS